MADVVKIMVDFDNYLGKLEYDQILELVLKFDINSDEWEECIPFKPDDWDKLDWREKLECKDVIRGCFESTIGKKAVYRARFKAEHGWSDQAFDDWWEGYSMRSLAENLEDFYKSNYYRNKRYHVGNYCNYLCLALAFLQLLILLALFFG